MANKQPVTGVLQARDGGSETASVGGEGRGSDETIDQHHAPPHPEKETHMSWVPLGIGTYILFEGAQVLRRAAVDRDNVPG